jgi:apolipoprotein N-acyltransferase
MRALLAEAKADWVFGSDDVSEGEEGRRLYNAAFHLQADGSLQPPYRKRRLVAFGEYVPLASWLPFLKWLTPIGEGFAAGNRPVAFRLGADVLASPVICFEDVFPQGIRDHVAPDTDFVLVLTNDGWFSESAAQWQHTAAAVFRSVENGVALVRACNNGITGWWDARGTPRDVLGDPGGDVYAPGVLLAQVPVGLPRVETPYHRHGDVFAAMCAALTAWRAVRRRKGITRPSAVPGRDAAPTDGRGPASGFRL